MSEILAWTVLGALVVGEIGTIFARAWNWPKRPAWYRVLSLVVEVAAATLALRVVL